MLLARDNPSPEPRSDIMTNATSHVILKPLRKNAKNANYRVLELNSDEIVGRVTTYETLAEAVLHAFTNKNGDIIATKKVTYNPGLIAFYCKYHNRMSFGFKASESIKSELSNMWWANFR